jgi:hypothetical protein
MWEPPPTDSGSGSKALMWSSWASATQHPHPPPFSMSKRPGRSSAVETLPGGGPCGLPQVQRKGRRDPPGARAAPLRRRLERTLAVAEGCRRPCTCAAVSHTLRGGTSTRAATNTHRVAACQPAPSTDRRRDARRTRDGEAHLTLSFRLVASGVSANPDVETDLSRSRWLGATRDEGGGGSGSTKPLGEVLVAGSTAGAPVVSGAPASLSPVALSP